VNIDRVTLRDLSFLSGSQDVFSLIQEVCTTQEGVAALRRHILHPPESPEQLSGYQDAVRFWMQHGGQWTDKVSNGTLVMIQKFYETADVALSKPNAFHLFLTALLQKLFRKESYSFELFSISHLADFVKGCYELTALLSASPPKRVSLLLASLQNACNHPLIQQLIHTTQHTSKRTWLTLGYQARRQTRATIFRMIQNFASLDALHAMAQATKKQRWALPELLPAEALTYEVVGLTHPLLTNPVGYDLSLQEQQRFLFLTGANMSGKSTLLYTLGIGALLAHLGMGVPARSMKISFLKGMITNMHVEDNILLGESYFFAEVQRMKQTALKLQHSPYHLVLMDELFKGTNGSDAYECTYAVVEALLKKRRNLMALSTHLSDLAEKLQEQPEVVFRYCETQIDKRHNYHFTYRLKEGVSRDRIGFLVLKEEGILRLLSDDEQKNGNDQA